MTDPHGWRRSRGQLSMIEMGGEIGDADFYPTPEWATRGLLDVCPPPKGIVVIEPAAGSGAIVQVLIERGYEVRAVEVRPRAMPALRDLCPAEWGSWMDIVHDADAWERLGMSEGMSIITNPPFAVAVEFAEACFDADPVYLALLLRINVLAARTWADLFRRHQPTTIAPLMRRPSFTPDGKTAMDNYAWIVWSAGAPPLDLRQIGG